MVQEDAISSLITMHMGLEFQENYRSFKTLPQMRVEEVKILFLYAYRAMLNTRPLGGEEIPLYVVVFCSIAEKKN
jgi:hypothetical protein